MQTFVEYNATSLHCSNTLSTVYFTVTSTLHIHLIVFYLLACFLMYMLIYTLCMMMVSMHMYRYWYTCILMVVRFTDVWYYKSWETKGTCLFKSDTDRMKKSDYPFFLEDTVKRKWFVLTNVHAGILKRYAMFFLPPKWKKYEEAEVTDLKQ